MNRFGRIENTKSYNRWKRKYYFGRTERTEMSRRFRARTSRRPWTRTGGRKYRRRRYKSKKYSLQHQINQLRKGVSGREWKTHDVETSGVLSIAGTIEPLTLISQGDTSHTREALRINMTSIQMLGNLETDESQEDPVLVRFILFQDMENDGVVPTVTELLEDDTDIRSMKNHLNHSRFRIMWDKLWALNPVGASPGGDVYLKRLKVVKYYKKTDGRKIHYLGSTATQAAQGKATLYLFEMCDVNANYPGYHLNWRIKFTG